MAQHNHALVRPLPALTDPERALLLRRRGPLRPTAPIARDVLLPDDPALALALAQQLLVRPRMANHSFGLWGYSGDAELGDTLTVQASGIGAPSVASVVCDLATHGAARVVRLGRCRALDPAATTDGPLIVRSALPGDGTSRALGADGALEPDRALSAALADAVPEATPARIASVDSLRTSSPQGISLAGPPRAVALDLETAALFALAARLGLAAGALLVISEPETELADDDLARRVLELGAGAARAFAAEAAQASASETASLR